MRLSAYFLAAVFIMSTIAEVATAQINEREEPEIIRTTSAKTPVGQGFSNGMAINIQLNDFGVAGGGEYRRAIGPTTEAILDFKITALRDVSEQQFQTLFGQQIIPNKYSRVMALPISIGLKQRLFAEHLSDNFRVNVQGLMGSTIAFVYPYFNDFAGLGYICRPNFPGCEGFTRNMTYQLPYDFFQGWGEGSFEYGTTGQIAIGVDFGEDFSRFQSVTFGYVFHYFPNGIQVLEPNSPFQGESGHVPRKFFGSPQITLTFGRMW